MHPWHPPGYGLVYIYFILLNLKYRIAHFMKAEIMYTVNAYIIQFQHKTFDHTLGKFTRNLHAVPELFTGSKHVLCSRRIYLQLQTGIILTKLGFFCSSIKIPRDFQGTAVSAVTYITYACVFLQPAAMFVFGSIEKECQFFLNSNFFLKIRVQRQIW